MWITSYLAKNRAIQAAASGSVTNADSMGFEVNSSRKYREASVVSPYGVYWIPPAGEQAVMLHTPGGDVCLGVTAGVSPELEPGELMLCSEGGASIVLKNDGTVLINGREYGGT